MVKLLNVLTDKVNIILLQNVRKKEKDQGENKEDGAMLTTAIENGLKLGGKIEEFTFLTIHLEF